MSISGIDLNVQTDENGNILPVTLEEFSDSVNQARDEAEKRFEKKRREQERQQIGNQDYMREDGIYETDASGLLDLNFNQAYKNKMRVSAVAEGDWYCYILSLKTASGKYTGVQIQLRDSSGSAPVSSQTVHVGFRENI